MKKRYLKYIWEQKTKAATFNWTKIDVENGDVFECSEKHFRSLTRMYGRLFKEVEWKELEEKKEKKENKKNKKSLSKKSK